MKIVGRFNWHTWEGQAESAWPMMETFLWRNLNPPGPHTVNIEKNNLLCLENEEQQSGRMWPCGLNKRIRQEKNRRSQPLATVPQLRKTSEIIQVLNTPQLKEFSSTSNFIKTLEPPVLVPFLFSLYDAESALNSTIDKLKNISRRQPLFPSSPTGMTETL